MAIDRNGSIKAAVDKGRTSEQINNSLIKYNLQPLSSYEKTLIDEGRYGTNLAQRFGQDLLEIGQGINTIGGYLGNLATNKKEQEQALNAIQDYSNKVASGEANIANDITNIVLSPYGITTTDIAANPLGSTKKAIEMTAAHPVNILDFAPVTKLVGGTKAASKAIDTIADATDNIPVVKEVRRALLPTEVEKQINIDLNLADAPYAKRTNELNRRLDELKADPNFEQAIKDLTLGTTEAGELTTKVRTLVKDIEKEMQRLGVKPEASRRTAVDQYIYEALNPDRTFDLIVNDVKIARNNPTTDNLAKLGVSKEDLFKLEKEGNGLYDANLITPITQRGLNRDIDTGVERLVRGIEAERLAGKATTKEVADNFVKGYSQLQKEINSIDIANDTLVNIAQKYGRKIDPTEVNAIAKDEVVVSPREFRDGLRDLYGANKQENITRFTSGFTSGPRKSTLVKYADDLYAVPKKNIQAWRNKTKFTPSSNPALRTINNALEIPSGLMKQSVLAKLPYFFGNRQGNFYLNAIGGGDYGELINRISEGKYAQDIPEYLLQTTSYHGLNPSLHQGSIQGMFARNTEDILQDIKDIKEGKPLSGSARLFYDINRTATSPLFQLESTFEVADRMAAYYGAAKRYGDKVGKTGREIVSEAKTNQRLQNRLLQDVNDTLGDYVGRNHFVDPELRRSLDVMVPFNKIITTSAQILPRTAMNRPLQYQGLFRVPSTIGQNIYQQQEEQYGKSNPDIRGGYTTSSPAYRGGPREVMYNSYNPFLAPLEYGAMLAPTKEDLLTKLGNQQFMNLSYIGRLGNVLKGEDAFGNPAVGPNTFKTATGKLITLDENGNKLEQGGSVGGAALNYVGSTFTPIATLLNQSVFPLAGSFGVGYTQPNSRSLFGQFGEAQVPYLMEGRPTAQPVNDFGDFVTSQTGFRTRELYPQFEQRITPQDLKQIYKKRRLRERQNIKRRRDR